MLTYALFIASDPDPVSSSESADLDQVFERARLSSGGTIVRVRASDGSHEAADDFSIPIATFVNGLHLELRDEPDGSFTYLVKERPIGRGERIDGDWVLFREPDDAGSEAREQVATLEAGNVDRVHVQATFGQLVEDWLT